MEHRSLQAVADRYTLPPSWHDFATKTVRALYTNRRDVAEWARLAMMLGDTRAPELCLIAALHATDVADDVGAATARVGGHISLASLDLGLAKYDRDSGKVTFEDGALSRYTDEFLAPLGGSIERGAHLCVGLVAIRAGLRLPLGDDPEALPAAAELADLDSHDLARGAADS